LLPLIVIVVRLGAVSTDCTLTGGMPGHGGQRAHHEKRDEFARIHRGLLWDRQVRASNAALLEVELGSSFGPKRTLRLDSR
jgi:hypothetical protein